MNPYHVFLHINRPAASFVKKQGLHWLVAFILSSVKKSACLSDAIVSQTSRYFDPALPYDLPILMDVEPYLKAKTQHRLKMSH